MAVMPLTAVAQDSIEASVEAGFVSRYMWRGQDLSGFSIQPAGELRWQGVTLRAAGSTGLHSDDLHEIDLSASYNYMGFNVGVTDYWETGIDPQNRFFYFDTKTTGHRFELNLGYTCEYFTAQAYTMMWGNDWKKNGKRAFSTYFEVGVPLPVRFGGLDWLVTAGITPFESAGYYTQKMIETSYGEAQANVPSYYYAEGFACISATLRATKTLFVGDVQLPMFVEFHSNPYLQTARVLVGVTIKP